MLESPVSALAFSMPIPWLDSIDVTFAKTPVLFATEILISTSNSLFVSTMVDVNEGSIKYDVERTGIGFFTDSRTEADQTIIKTTCSMERPDS